VAGVAARDRAVDPQRLRDLVPDGEERVEGAHRVLEDHRDVGAAQPAQPLRVGTDEFLALEPDRASRHAAAAEQPEHRERRHALARSGLPHHGKGLARRHAERHPGHGLDRPGRRREPHGEVTHVEQWRRHDQVASAG
jgi:hypothetical protein